MSSKPALANFRGYSTGCSGKKPRLFLNARDLPSPHTFITSDVIAAVSNPAHIGC
jgi:hypothetical protein